MKEWFISVMLLKMRSSGITALGGQATMQARKVKMNASIDNLKQSMGNHMV